MNPILRPKQRVVLVDELKLLQAQNERLISENEALSNELNKESSVDDAINFIDNFDNYDLGTIASHLLEKPSVRDALAHAVLPELFGDSWLLSDILNDISGKISLSIEIDNVYKNHKLHVTVDATGYDYIIDVPEVLPSEESVA